ncbi:MULTISPECIES: ABC transporter ATP-binding protein [Anaerococcus]|uniref:ABC transporter ATP-binding protein n=1 Tax=Anaerococcus TaxID=165779 RepID=UPI002902F407|nr:ABC transporter ATP-binding protein [Anaerococcus vaginalis]MDU1707094.1 ABC transporter ATP-binding protein [Anaerococcus vaginalis]MDU1762652.1 ABC transporter ATP-binding protein [Anaerococcus vaginalis]
MNILEVKNLRKVYNSEDKNTEVVALKDINFEVEEGEFVAIMGESGSGKSTLLNLIATLDKQTSGDVILSGENTKNKSDKERAKFRREKLGFVYQDFSLLSSLNNRDNIFLPLVLENEKYKIMEEKLAPIASALKIENLLDKFPYQISGGQKQRVAVARSLITNPKILLADEPTGALDSNSSMELLNIFEKINKNGQTILMVTHSTMAAARASRVLFIKDGKIFYDLYKGDRTNDQMYEKLVKSQMMILSGGERFEQA